MSRLRIRARPHTTVVRTADGATIAVQYDTAIPRERVDAAVAAWVASGCPHRSDNRIAAGVRAIRGRRAMRPLTIDGQRLMVPAGMTDTQVRAQLPARLPTALRWDPSRVSPERLAETIFDIREAPGAALGTEREESGR